MHSCYGFRVRFNSQYAAGHMYNIFDPGAVRKFSARVLNQPQPNITDVDGTLTEFAREQRMRVADIHEEKHRRRRKRRLLGWSRMLHCRPPIEMVYLMNRWMQYFPSHFIWKQSKTSYTDEEADFHAKRIRIRKQYPIHRITESEEPPEPDDDVDEGHEGGVIIENQARKGRDLSMEVEETAERTPLCECPPFSSPIEHDSPSSASEEARPYALTSGRHLESPSPARSSSESGEHPVRYMAQLAIHHGDDDIPSPHTHTLITRPDTHTTLRYHCAIHGRTRHPSWR